MRIFTKIPLRFVRECKNSNAVSDELMKPGGDRFEIHDHCTTYSLKIPATYSTNFKKYSDTKASYRFVKFVAKENISIIYHCLKLTRDYS